MMNKGRLVVISGPSGVGKGTVIRRLLGECENLRLSVSATTRAPRNEDTEGVTYFFKTVDEFRSMIDNSEFLEWAVYNGNYYGTPCAAVEENLECGLNVILEIDVQGALEVMKKRPDAVYIFIAPPNRETLMQRLVGRGTETEEQIKKRCAAAAAELEQQDKYDYVVINDVLDDAVGEIKSIIEGKNVK
ncbi:MAG: guanylate kinase [Monoglobaceae bacterium]